MAGIGGIGQLSQAVQSARSAALKSGVSGAEKTGSFQKVLQASSNKVSGENMMNSGVNQAAGPSGLQHVSGLNPSAKAGATTPPKKVSPVEKGVKDLMNSMSKSTDAFDKIFDVAMRSPKMNMQQMLALQAVANKASLIASASSKLVEKGVESIQQFARTQV